MVPLGVRGIDPLAVPLFFFFYNFHRLGVPRAGTAWDSPRFGIAVKGEFSYAYNVLVGINW